MARRRLAALVTLASLAALAGAVRVFAPEQFEAGVDAVDRAPEPVVVGVLVVFLSLVGILLLVYVVKLYYWAWRQVEQPVTRLWNAILPESPIVRFGAGAVVMVLVFLVGPLVVLQALDFLGSDGDPIEESRNSSNNDTDNATDSDGDAETASAHVADKPDSADEPPDSPA